MNRSDRELKNDWEESWERNAREQGRGFTPVQIFLIVIAAVLLIVLIAMLVFYFFM